MTIYYHGTDATITAFAGTVCLTNDWDVAESYAEGKDEDAPIIYTVDADLTTIADEDDLAAAATTLGWTRTADCVAGDWTDIYELADSAAIRDALAADGYQGVEYIDTTYQGRTHQTVMVWDTAALTITDREEIAA